VSHLQCAFKQGSQEHSVNYFSFYRYIFNEILSPEDRKRTHIFDTFFYQKLTQRVPKQEKSEEKMRYVECKIFIGLQF